MTSLLVWYLDDIMKHHGEIKLVSRTIIFIDVLLRKFCLLRKLLKLNEPIFEWTHIVYHYDRHMKSRIQQWQERRKTPKYPRRPRSVYDTKY